jgi:hypothetical protein
MTSRSLVIPASVLALEEFFLNPKAVPSNSGPSQELQLLYLCYLPNC